MPFLMALFYDRAIAKTEEACLRQWRQDLLRQLHGDVLELGAGTGANIGFYPEQVRRLVLSEPDRHMRRQLSNKLEGLALANASVAGGSAERIEAEDESFDWVVSSLVCCSVNDLQASLVEVTRVLKPGGGFVFMEHVAAAEGTSRRKWQNRLNPLWKTFMGNCHLNRETEQAIVDAGLEIAQIERESMRKAPPIVRPTIRGIAIKPEREAPADAATRDS